MYYTTVTEILKRFYRVNAIPSFKGKDDALNQMLGYEEGKVVRYLSMSKLYTLYKMDKLYTSYLEIQLKLPATTEAELKQSQNTMDRKTNRPKVTGTQSQTCPLPLIGQWNRERDSKFYLVPY